MIKSKSNLIKFTAGIFFALQLISAIAILTCPLPAEAQSQADSVNSLIFTPQVSIPDSEFVGQTPTTVGVYDDTTGKMDSTLLARYISAIYNYGLAIAGILATLVLMGAGVIWLTSGGDSGKITQAKDLISGSIAGLIILIISWVILNTINPNLVNLKSISTTIVEKVIIQQGCCEKGSQAKMIDTKKECDQDGGIYIASDNNYNVTVANGRCLQSYVYCVVRVDCDGKIQSCYDTDINTKPVWTSNCGTLLNPVERNMDVLQTGRCSEIKIKEGTSIVSGCAGKQATCVGAKDGTVCQTDNGQTLAGWCYDNLCYSQLGKENERCGIRIGAFCSSLKCGDMTNAKYLEDTTGIGRECRSAALGSDQMNCCFDSKNDLPYTNPKSPVWGPDCGNERGRCYLLGSPCPSGFNHDIWGKNCTIGWCCKAD